MKNCRNKREGDGDRDDYAQRAGNGQSLEMRQPGKLEAEKRPGDSQTGGQDNLGDPVVCGVIRRFPVLAGVACLVVSAEKEYPVIGSCRDPDRYQQINGKGSKTDHPLIAEERDESSGHLQFYPDHHQQNHYGDNRTVDEEQRGKDDGQAHHRDEDDGPVTTAAHVRNDRRGSGDIRLDSRRRRRPRYDIPDGLGRIVRHGRTRPTGEVHLHICGLTIGALRGASREWIAPEILDVPHMIRIALQLTNQTIVVPVGIVAEGLLALQDDHCDTVGISFVEVLTHAPHRLERRCIGGIQRQ